MKRETSAQHPAEVKLPQDNHALIQPIYHSVKFYFDNFSGVDESLKGKRKGFGYSRISNPTNRQLELALANLQGCEDGVVFSSGVAALSNVLFSLLKKGDHVVLFYESYAPGRGLIQNILQRFGVDHTIVSIRNRKAIESAFVAGKTKLVLFESPTNPTLALCDIGHLVATAKRNKSLIIMDNTFAGIHNHHNLGIDLFVHSLTKFVVGSGDAMGGAVLGSAELLNSLRPVFYALGAHMDPRVADQCLKGLKTYFLRYKKHCENAEHIATFLSLQEQISDLVYPAFYAQPELDLAKKQMEDFGGVICFRVGKNQQDMISFLDKLKMIRLTGSLGSVETLIAPCMLFYGSDLQKTEQVVAGLFDNTVRLSVGLENIEDIVADLKQALH